jgi:hypothetical protein
MIRASAAKMPRSKDQAPVAATQNAPVMYVDDFVTSAADRGLCYLEHEAVCHLRRARRRNGARYVVGHFFRVPHFHLLTGQANAEEHS